MTIDDLLALVKRFAEQRYPGDPVDKVIILLKSGRERSYPLPDVFPEEPRPEAEEHPQIEADIIVVLEAAGKPLKREAIFNALKRAAKRHGESTVYRHLAAMRKDGLLEITDDGYKIVD